MPREDEVKQKATLMAMEKTIPTKNLDQIDSQILVGGYLQNMDKHTLSNNLTVPKVIFCIVSYFESNLKHI